jgi:hypothetical protein
LIPPQLQRFTDAEELLVPNQHKSFTEIVSKVAQEGGFYVIDCLLPANCGLSDEDFGDPVHLNDGGAKKFTRAISARLQSLRLLPETK